MSSNYEIEVDDNNFKSEVLDSQLPCLVDFWAQWCRPCMMIAPAIEEIAKKYDGKIKVCKVNIDEAGQVSSDYGIMSIPTLVIFKDGNVVDKMVGAVSKDAIEDFIGPYIN